MQSQQRREGGKEGGSDGGGKRQRSVTDLYWSFIGVLILVIFVNYRVRECNKLCPVLVWNIFIIVWYGIHPWSAFGVSQAHCDIFSTGSVAQCTTCAAGSYTTAQGWIRFDAKTKIIYLYNKSFSFTIFCREFPFLFNKHSKHVASKIKSEFFYFVQYQNMEKISLLA